MGQAKHKPVIVRGLLLDRRDMQETGRVIYSFLLLDETGQQIVARPFASKSLAEVVDYVNKEKAKAKIGRVKFDPPPGIDGSGGRNPRRYEALTLHEIFWASPALGQS